MRFEYGGVYKRFDMHGTMKLGNGWLKVQDITEPTPSFMEGADCVFVNPPSTIRTLREFYRKANTKVPWESYTDFIDRLFAVIDDITPRVALVEAFPSNRDRCLELMRYRYPHVREYSVEFKGAYGVCWIVQGSEEETDLHLDRLKECEVVEALCDSGVFETIANPMMGLGEVGRCAYNHGMGFVGTEMNPKRLAVLIDYITRRRVVLEHESRV